MEKLKNLDLSNWTGVVALALVIAIELLTADEPPQVEKASFVDREKARRAKDNLDWLTR